MDEEAHHEGLAVHLNISPGAPLTEVELPEPLGAGRRTPVNTDVPRVIFREEALLDVGGVALAVRGAVSFLRCSGACGAPCGGGRCRSGRTRWVRPPGALPMPRQDARVRAPSASVSALTGPRLGGKRR